ncbi:dihydrolipoyl dehydrogenase [Marinomonas posidonica]|uniref:Dihydrolipoyl dehydrogenase n=1 Tax=Marinomonas posidonica (strain CECT 7376 / NCIMB 14433 / IVIA-Po-181) TaxID=491952 RepID=F6CYY7_MARPP|nr:dihydrolipoyl dehydrogenase [Marinomonas posidonica]AEF53114.1 dihydrolipoamide dehydrogenase [Marinomonas posidonica IVIA-Po-181]
MKFDLVVLGSGPGGYAAAFRAADLGLKVAMIERHKRIGGVCLNVGCIPSKALLHVAGKIRMADEDAHGVTYAKPKIDLEAIRHHRQSTVDTLTGNLALMAKGRKVEIFHGEGQFESTHSISVTQDNDRLKIEFENAIIAVGSRAIRLPFVPYDDPRILDATSALQLERIPKHMLVLGGGIIGLEMATVYQALGAKITVAELGEQIMTGADKDLVRVFEQTNKDRMTFLTKTQVTDIQASSDTLNVTLKDQNGQRNLNVDAVLVAVGRSPNGRKAGIPDIGVELDDRGFVTTDTQCRTSIPNIFAIGDVTHGPMLAHKASHQGHIAAEVISGHKVDFQPLAIPSIAYTFPEVAWVGLTEIDAKKQGIPVKTATFPWSASGRAIASGITQGKTKLIYDEASERVLGAGVVGAHAGELLGELTLAIEFGATLEDIALTIHAHPSLHESVGLAAELGAGTITDLPNRKAKR